MRGNVFFPLGRSKDCVAEQRLALDWAERSGSTEAIARALGGLGDAEYAEGHLGRAGAAFRRCVAAAREAGLGRSEVANAPMVAICMLDDLDIEAMLAAANEAIALARRVGQIRPEMIAQHALIQAAIESGRFELVPPAFERAQAIVRELNAVRFEPENLIFLADMQHRAGEPDAAQASARLAIDSLRASGSPTYFGPVVLAIAARIATDRDAAQARMAEAETYLPASRLAHNHLYLRREGIDLGWSWRDAALIARHADALEEFLAGELGGWPRFVLNRARLLAQAVSGPRDAAWRQRLADLRSVAAQKRLLMLDRALAEAEAQP